MSNNENSEFLKIFASIFIILSVFGGFVILVNISDSATEDSRQYYIKELNAEVAIIKSPAIIKIVDSYSDFKNISGKVYIYNGVFYKVPDTYIGYMWKPNITVTSLNGIEPVWELVNK